MKYSQQIWDQLKNISVERLIGALEKSNWTRDVASKKFYVYLHPTKGRVVIHFHSQKTYGPKMLKGILDTIGWSEKELKDLKLIK